MTDTNEYAGKTLAELQAQEQKLAKSRTTTAESTIAKAVALRSLRTEIAARKKRTA